IRFAGAVSISVLTGGATANFDPSEFVSPTFRTFSSLRTERNARSTEYWLRFLRGGSSERRPLFRSVQNFTSIAAIVAANNAVLGHEINQPSRSAVTDAERTL